MSQGAGESEVVKAPLSRALIRTLHHMPCTGGTLIAKCLAALPSVVLLNEVDPYSTHPMRSQEKAIFSPTDLAGLLHQSGCSFDGDLKAALFVAQMKVLAPRLADTGACLILREHTHGAYLVGPRPRKTGTLRAMLEPEFELLSVVTVRHPVDSYLSLLANRWVHYQPATLSEYCRRYLSMLDDHSGLPNFKYEDFVAKPSITLRKIALALNLKYSPDYKGKFFDFKFSGDSGRSSPYIRAQPRRPLEPRMKRVFAQSKPFEELAQRLGYSMQL